MEMKCEFAQDLEQSEPSETNVRMICETQATHDLNFIYLTFFCSKFVH